MTLPVSILAEMIRTNSDLFRFALLFPAYARDRETHRICVQYYSSVSTLDNLTQYFRLGQIHRDHFNADGAGPACIITGYDMKLEIWYHMGQVHRPFAEGPAEIRTFEKKSYVRKWFEWGEPPKSIHQLQKVTKLVGLHFHYVDRYVNLSNNIVGITRYLSDSYVLYQQYWKNGRYQEKWMNNQELLHRDETCPRGSGPAISIHDSSRTKLNDLIQLCPNMKPFATYTRIWYIMDKIHRIDGPAIETDGEYGDQWFVRGEPLMVWRAAVF